MRVTLRTQGDTIVAKLRGKLNSQTVERLAPLKDAVTSETKRVVLECKHLEYLSSAGLREIIKLKRQLPPDASLELHDTNTLVTDVFRQTGLDTHVTLVPAVEENSPEE